jgi:hypothetical protein
MARYWKTCRAVLTGVAASVSTQPPDLAPARYITCGRAALPLRAPAEGAGVTVRRHASPGCDLAELVGILGASVAREEARRILALLC